MPQAYRDPPFHAGLPKRTVDEVFLGAVAAPGGLIHEMGGLVKLLERQGVANGGMARAHHTGVMFLEQYLAVHGAVEFFEIAHGQIHIAGFQADELKILPNLEPNEAGASSETFSASRRHASSGFGRLELPVECGALDVSFVYKSSLITGEMAVKR